MKKVSLSILLILLSVGLFAGLPLGQKAPVLKLSGGDGGRVDDTPWSSNELVGKVWVVVHADPDESELNNAATEALKAEDYPKDVYGSVALINMAATWKPNFAINLILSGKQEDYPSTVYVRDNNNMVGKKWGLADDSNNIVVFDPSGKVIFSVDGKVSDKDIKKMIALINAEIELLRNPPPPPVEMEDTEETELTE
ncbi:MAG: YtfJ family protein [Candidatus Marinimicrobia bacterium]|nr:YtfJ family protein [Candidatus Neomarinimicrobiota bacterium]MCF7923271.1 YtfJ family protein [Candidatus Neomarinimicrobiota bacterium]